MGIKIVDHQEERLVTRRNQEIINFLIDVLNRLSIYRWPVIELKTRFGVNMELPDQSRIVARPFEQIG